MLFEYSLTLCLSAKQREMYNNNEVYGMNEIASNTDYVYF